VGANTNTNRQIQSGNTLTGTAEGKIQYLITMHQQINSKAT